MQRLILAALIEWLKNPLRKPLILRGARQVGKTWVVQQLAKNQGLTLIEINFEKNPSLAKLFASNDPNLILMNLSAHFNIPIDINQSLLFLDEIQAAPEILAKLRWFAEELPQLPVIAAGSLLEFVLANHSFSMPVGRISYMHLEPLSFTEFLLAEDKKTLVDYLQQVKPTDSIPEPIHQQLLGLIQEYTFVGGMPAVVNAWCQTRQLSQVMQLQEDLLATYRDDFAKYAGRLELQRLEDILNAIPTMLGKKFVYSHVNKGIPAASLKHALSLLTQAKLCSPVASSHANGIPLAAEVDKQMFKVIGLDSGLICRLSGLNLSQINQMQNIINSGELAEQLVGQLLRSLPPFYIEPKLFYWVRHKKGSEAEIDYLIQHQTRIIPIEVKAGSTGSLKSLHLFMGLKNLDFAIRINGDALSLHSVQVKNSLREDVNYQLLSIPFYLVEQLPRMLEINL